MSKGGAPLAMGGRPRAGGEEEPCCCGLTACAGFTAWLIANGWDGSEGPASLSISGATIDPALNATWTLPADIFFGAYSTFHKESTGEDDPDLTVTVFCTNDGYLYIRGYAGVTLVRELAPAVPFPAAFGSLSGHTFSLPGLDPTYGSWVVTFP